MTEGEIWQGLDSEPGPFFRLVRFVLIAFGMVAMFFFGSLALPWPQQAVLGLLMVGATTSVTRLTHRLCSVRTRCLAPRR